MQKKAETFRVPHTFAIIFTIILLVAAATWILPGGEFDREKNKAGKTTVVANTYHPVESKPQGIKEVFMSPLKGMEKAANIAGFILIVGGAFAVIQKTGAIDAGIMKMIRLLKGKEILLIPITMTMFSAGGAIFGMSEETIPFVGIFVPMALLMGYDRITGMCIPYVAATTGFAGAMLNPFTVGIAQSFSELPAFSGIEYRTGIWVASTVLAISFVMWYARRIKRNPELSPTYEEDKAARASLQHLKESNATLTTGQQLVLTLLVAGMALIVLGVLKWEWYIDEIAAVFLGMGIFAGIFAKMSTNDIADAFVVGAKDMVSTAILVGLARAIVVLASDAKIIDTILNTLAAPLAGLPTLVSAYAMLIVQIIINFFVTSGTGQAALTIPIMASLGDLVGITRQTTVLIYQFGNGFSDMIFPTSSVLIGCLGMAGIPWSKWARWVLPLQIAFFVLCVIAITPAVLMKWGPF
ncbi:YfcC family protein [Sporomusa aerivorans]|uniref:YfcC family protein n=1 Tax=Sporomusa aerivorans TaxID=204936 RepID=UPI00352BB4E4